MAETVRSQFDRREPLALDRDRDGEASKPPLPPTPRGRGCSRKRKGTPVKVCDRVFATEDDEENTLEHGYGPGNGQERTENKHRSGPYCTAESAQACHAETGEQSSSSGRGAVLYPPPNCRIREVHCGSQVRLVVVAIRDITKGEEITVDYNPSEWGENAMTRGLPGSVPAAASEPSPDQEKNIKKEEESGSGPVSDFVTPSWSLSPKSSQLSHSELSDSDDAEPRSRTPRRRKKHRKLSSSAAANTNANSNDKRKPPHPPPHRPPGRPPSQPLPHSLPSCPPQPPAPSRPVFKCPAPAGVGGSTVNVGGGRGVSPVTQKQCCVYCGRHYRSLQRHLDKHHAHQPDVRAAMLKSQGSAHLPHLHASLPSSSSSSSSASGHNRNHRDAIVIPTQQSPAPPPPPPPPPQSVSPARKNPALTSPSPRKSPAPPPPTTPPRRGGGVPVSVLKRSPPTPVTPPRKAGRKKKETEELDVMEKMKEEFVEVLKQVEDPKVEEEENEEEGEEDDDSSAEDKSDLSSSRRPHMLPLLSSLSSLVLYLRRLQHSAFISLSRSPQSAEAWRLLCHSSLALLILYNRRRECEVSKLTISEYQARVTPQSSAPLPPSALTPLEASLSPFERLVLPHLPRVGVQGKRGRVQPLILPPHSEHCLELLLQTRAGVGVDPQNPYVFARPYHSPATPLRGTDLLRNLAKSSGTRHPRALTQTRVRRQVAILTQLLMLSEGEEEGQRGAAQQRLENFLQKEYHVTQSCATIGQDPGLMGLIGRVVLCGERDGVLFRGMSLHHICLELDVMSGNSADSLSEESDGEQEKDKSESPTIMMKKSSSSTKPPRLKKMGASPFSPNRKRGSGQPKPGKRGVLKRPWSEAERAAVESHLVRNIMELRVPAKADCERCLEQCPLLVTNRRDWRAIKFYCHNRIQLLKKTQQRQSPPTLSVC
ncbi:uncharacterized protein si:dkey-117m1.4 [Pangasianodon hypophthalmus]|uniref:uncharacterized protein si:dkey-117m1.4 n=1 Tax=Pangasianodon hypophthalmus TaxID=310915 RepID=UPI0023077D87|nr:uncharacterized protein si:dkey-117m1.4 [Pangasianodon hypophthalmus]